MGCVLAMGRVVGLLPRLEEATVTGLQAITLDLWGTILQPRDAEAKIERWLALLLEALAEARCPVDAARCAKRTRPPRPSSKPTSGRNAATLAPWAAGGCSPSGSGCRRRSCRPRASWLPTRTSPWSFCPA